MKKTLRYTPTALFLLCGLLFASFTFLKADLPRANLWQTLLKVKWHQKYSKELKTNIDYPEFTAEIKALNGKEITISGYIVPIDMYGGDGSYFVLSAYPASSCFFCGAAGPESVMEVYPLKKGVFQGSKFTVKGKLKLNADNPDHLIYVLEGAVQVED
jgi:hypothetical protein